MTGLRAAWRRWSVSPALIGLTRARITLQWRLAGKPVPPPHIVKQQIVISYARKYGLRTFIETGTFTGEMVAAMANDADRIISVEISPELHAQVQRRFAGVERVQLLLGDSGALLPTIVASLNEPALFWLDGHYMGEGSGRGRETTPVIAEIAAIADHPVRGHVVLIDDARLFDGTDGYPRLNDFLQFAKTRRPDAAIAVDGDIIRMIL